jgi:plastocyanin
VGGTPFYRPGPSGDTGGLRVAIGKLARLFTTMLLRRARPLALCSLIVTLPLPSSRMRPGAEAAPPPAPATPRQATGRIEGEVIVSTALSSHRPRFRIYADPGPGARPPAQQTDEMRNIVLYLRSAPVPESATPDRVRIAQSDEQFVPHVVPVLRGSTVDFPNADVVFHNVFSLSSAKSFDLGRYPKGQAKSVTFDESGVVQVFCHIHSDMSAIVLVLDNPFFTTPAADGRYVLENVPAGDYTVVGWHERIRPVLRTVHVAAGETARLNFNIPLPTNGQDAPPPAAP